MSIMAIHPEIRASFSPALHGFASRNGGPFISCPPYVIAGVAVSGRADSVVLPDGYDAGTLERIKSITGWVDQEMFVSDRQARELAQIGRQLLALNSENKIQPQLSVFEEQSITHLVSLLGAIGKVAQ